MHRKNPISVLVYNTLFPTPSPTDPPSFSAHLSKNLVGEVRIETANFYGSLDTIEARYPGLNYASAPHRKRLGRFPHHRRLFEAFDRLGLTEAEIQGFCRWEGTLWARERYERDEGVRVIDTTGQEIGEWVDKRALSKSTSTNPSSSTQINVKTDIEVEIVQVPSTSSTSPSQQPQQHQQRDIDTPMPDNDSASSSSESSDSEEDLTASTSIGFSLNARLLQAAALRDQGAAGISMDPEWEQYLKEAQERGELNIDAAREALRNIAGQVAAAQQQQQQQQSSNTSQGLPHVSQHPAAPA